MALQIATLPDGREISCINVYEVAFSVHEIFSEDLSAHGIALPPGGTYLDVGANIGLFSLYLRDRCPAGRIVAYEPIAEVFAALERNLAGLMPPGEAVPLGLGAAPGRVDFDYFPGVAALSTAKHEVGERMAEGLRRLLGGAADGEVRRLIAQSGTRAGELDAALLDELLRVERVEAELDTLSNQLAVRGIGRVDLLKIDTEGAEEDVLAGIAEADWPKIGQLLVEAHLGRDAAEKLAAELRGRGYRTEIGGHPLSNDKAAVFHIYAVQGG